MQLKEMLSQVSAELNYIPGWPEPQGELRMLYNVKRMRSLGKKAEGKNTRSQILEQSIQQLKGDYPNYEFKYDREFFAETA